MIGLVNIFLLFLIKFVNFLFRGVKQIAQNLIFMLKGILRISAWSFFEEDTLVLGALFKLWLRDTHALGLAGSDGVFKTRGLDGGPKLG